MKEHRECLNLPALCKPPGRLLQPFFNMTMTGLVSLTAALALTGSRCRAATDLIVHEWGTFTSIQGSDGTLLYWNGVETSELPKFVYNWSRPGLGRGLLAQVAQAAPVSKQSFVALQRMETPVIYFYTKQRREVSVAVRFPQGTITEWFPQAERVGPSMRPPNPHLQKLDQWLARSGIHPGFSFVNLFGEKPVTNSVIKWRNLQIIPQTSDSSWRPQLPLDDSGKHYFFARETDAAFVRVRPLERHQPGPEFEKFLFYRGVGQFHSPLKVTFAGEDITVENTGTATLTHLFALEVGNDRASFISLKPLGPGESRRIQSTGGWDPLPLTLATDHISRELAQALTEEGLYAREAEAMVHTWQDSWFQEPGMRILYLLPRQWTDRILPIDIEPAPRELVRVMLGRAELITPAMEEKVSACVSLFRRQDEASRSKAVKQFQSLGLGRFAAPAIDRVIGQSTDSEFNRNARNLLQAVRAAATRVASTDPAQSDSGRPASNGG